MIVGIHQPNFAPWCGFFYKMFLSDVFVLMDSVQYSKGTVINRVKIGTRDGWIWLTVPVLTKGRFGQEIREVEVNNGARWREAHLKSLRFSYGKSPYFDEYYQMFDAVYSAGLTKLVDISRRLIEEIAGRLGIRKVRTMMLSDLSVEGRGSDLVLNVVKRLNGRCYLSGTGAKAYNKEEDFARSGIELVYLEFTHPHYPQTGTAGFLEGLSVVDLLFEHGPEALEIIRQPNAEFEARLRESCV